MLLTTRSRDRTKATMPKAQTPLPHHHHHQHGSRQQKVSHRHNSRDRLASYAARSSGMSREDREDLIPALALRSYHLPGYSYCEDWRQYFCNNHPLWGICCHHKLHPVGVRMRLVNLVGSIFCGLAITNIIWLWFIFNEIDEEQVVLSVSFTNGMFQPQTNVTSFVTGSANTTDAGDYDDHNNNDVFIITTGTLLLWSIGSFVHAFFDNTIWYLTACVCCQPGQGFEHWQRYQKYSNQFIYCTVLLVTAMATLVVVWRAALEQQQQQQQQEEQNGETITLARTASAYDFLVSYCVEMALALLVYWPLIGFLLWSGVFGCGCIPILGGRPYEVALEERRRRKSERNRMMGSSTEHSTPSVSTTTP